MPTQAEFQELIDNCETIEYLKYNDVYGYLLTIDDDKSLFFPEAGYYSHDSGFLYWTSTPYNSSSAVKFGMSYGNSLRYLGGSIRAVTDGDSTDKSIEDIFDEAPEQLYLVGLNDDWDSYDIKLTPSNDDNSYEYQGIATVTSCSSGYVVYVEEDNDFLTFSSDTGRDDGTLVYQGSENIPFNNTGIYIWTVDLANFTYSYTAVTTVSYSGLNNDYTLVEMTQDSDNPYTYTAEIEITTASTDGIKIVLNGNSKYYLGGDSGDIEFLSTITDDDLDTGTYTLTIDFSEMTYGIIDETGLNIACKIDGYIYVDLGLPSGLKWAIKNIGATVPADYGNYYAWGETKTRSNFTSGNSVTYGRSMSDISGNSYYDAATANWSSSWRMPTNEEFYELRTECSWTSTTKENSDGEEIEGYIAEGPNGNSIFFPAGGCYSGTSNNSVGEFYYWTSTPYSSYSYPKVYAYYSGYKGAGATSKYIGMLIRPVTD